jgi:hypothetical protein
MIRITRVIIGAVATPDDFITDLKPMLSALPVLELDLLKADAAASRA